MFCDYFPFLLYSQSTEEKLEKRLEEAKVLETSAVLELKRLGQEIIEEVEKREEVGAECRQVTTKVNRATSLGNSRFSCDVIIFQN